MSARQNIINAADPCSDDVTPLQHPQIHFPSSADCDVKLLNQLFVCARRERSQRRWFGTNAMLSERSLCVTLAKASKGIWWKFSRHSFSFICKKKNEKKVYAFLGEYRFTRVCFSGVIHSNHEPISYRFREKRRFLSKIATLSQPHVFNACTESCCWNFVTAVALKNKITSPPDGGKSLNIYV